MTSQRVQNHNQFIHPFTIRPFSQKIESNTSPFWYQNLSCVGFYGTHVFWILLHTRRRNSLLSFSKNCHGCLWGNEYFWNMSRALKKCHVYHVPLNEFLPWCKFNLPRGYFPPQNYLSKRCLWDFKVRKVFFVFLLYP